MNIKEIFILSKSKTLELNKKYGKNKFKLIYKIIAIGLKGLYKVTQYKIREIFKLKYYINLDNIDIEIITACNLSCYNCDRSCGTAVSGEMMSIEQIKYFIEESKKNNKKWNDIKILGGEPTLHPKFFEILDLLREYQLNFSPDTSIALATNGYGKKVNEVLSKLPEWVRVINTAKTSNIQEFSTYNVAACDLREYKSKSVDYTSGCWILESCGLGLTPNGFYACGAGGSADRIFGWNIGKKSLHEVNNKSMRKQLNTMCRFCGHFKDYGRYKYSSYGLVKKQMNSKSWELAYKKYKEKKPELDKYRDNRE